MNTVRSSSIFELGQTLLADQAHLGGKASNLNMLLAAQFPVPAGFILTGERQSGDLGDWISRIGGFPVAVRSSGALEDLTQASFAGLYETFLNIHSLETLTKAIKDCFASSGAIRVKDYLQAKNIPYEDSHLKMSVLIQKMVPAKISGVLFTSNPINGREEEMFLEFCEGLGERLVSGHVTPSRVSYNWISDKKVSEEINQERTQLNDFKIRELVRLAEKIQAFFGSPQDIEWAIGEDDKIYILQSRPITTFIPRDNVPELTNADFKDGGVSARVCTPFMFSVYRDAMKVSIGEYFKKIKLISSDEEIQWIFYHYGRVYWNAEAVKEGLKKIPNFREELFDQGLGLQKDYGKNGPHTTPATLSHMVNAIPILIGLYQEFRDCENMISLFRTDFEFRDEKLKRNSDRLQTLSEKEFKLWFLEVILLQNQTEKNYFRTIYNNSNYQTELKNLLQKVANFETGDEIELMSHLEGVSHMNVQEGLLSLKKTLNQHGLFSEDYLKARETFLKTHYHHGPCELDLLVPRWGEKKEWVDELVKNASEIHRSPTNNYEKTKDKILKGVSFFKKSKIKKNILRSRNFLRHREEMRSFSTRAYYLLRLGLLEFSRRFNLNEKDAFMLDIKEIKKALVTDKFSLPDISKRRLLYDGYSKYEAPNEFGGGITSLKSDSSHNVLQGLGCSAGEVVGRARVIYDVHETHDLIKDDILVTKFTDPGWTPVLAKVRGVVTEVGGLLSHAAVIGREYGIPAILNVIDATKIIKEGDLIRINGKSGRIEILEKGP